MSTQQLREEVLALPEEERLALAQELLESVDGPGGFVEDPEFHAELRRRSAEMQAGKNISGTMEEVLGRIRRQIGCV